MALCRPLLQEMGNRKVQFVCSLCARKSELSDRMHEDRLAGFDQPPSTERANKPWIGFLPALHYPSIYWWHYVMVSIIQP